MMHNQKTPYFSVYSADCFFNKTTHFKKDFCKYSTQNTYTASSIKYVGILSM